MTATKTAPKPKRGKLAQVAKQALEIQYWPIGRLKPYAKNPRKNDQAVDQMAASIKEFGFSVPVLARSSGEVVDGHLRLKAASRMGMTEVPVIPCDGWTEAQVKAFRLMVNRSVAWADWDLDALAGEFAELKALDFDLTLTGFDMREIDQFTLTANPAEDDVPPVPETPTSRTGDLWLLGGHRLLCGDATSAGDVARLLNGNTPFLMVTDPPYGVKLDGEWRDRAGANGMGPAEPNYMRARDGIAGVSSDTRADWSEAFALVPSIQIAYVWHASLFTSEVLAGLIRIGFLYPQQIIWDKGIPVLTRTHYWFQHEPCWYVRKKRAPWIGSAGQGTVWKSASPKFLMGGSKEEKFDHPTQKPVDLMKKSILNHTGRGDAIYEPFGGSGTTLAAAEVTERLCICSELDPRYTDVIVTRWQNLTSKSATLEGDGRTFEAIQRERFLIKLGAQDEIKEEVLSR